MFRKHALILGMAVGMTFARSLSAAASPEIKLYALDCGSIEMKDMGGFSDTGEYDGQPGRLVIQHDLKDFEGLPKFPKYLD